MRSGADPRPLLSVILPAYNEEQNILKALTSIGDCDAEESPLRKEVIVVDGGSSDSTVEVATDWGATVIASPRGRAAQMNAGWRQASGDWFLFLHSDSQLPSGYDEHLGSVILREAAVSARAPPPGSMHALWRKSSQEWGYFHGIRTDISSWVMRGIEAGVWSRTLLFGLPFGDQGLFMKRECMRAAGGYKEIKLLEDVDLVGRLRQHGRPAVIPASILTSGRRWEKLGVWRTTYINNKILLLYALGWDPNVLAEYYTRGRAPPGPGRSAQ